LKVRGDKQSVTNSGRLFHARGPATAKARSPSDERRVAGTTRVDDDANCSRRRDVTSATDTAAPCHEGTTTFLIMMTMTTKFAVLISSNYVKPV